MQTNVNNKKAKVEFPKLEEITLPKPKLFINPKANKHSKLGQSIPIVNHKIKTPIKINITPNASLVKPLTGGINCPTKHKITQIGMIIDLKIILSFNLVFILFFYS